FGLFAGCSVGRIGKVTRLALGEPCRRHSRLDTDYVALLADALSRDPVLREDLRFRPNTSLCRTQGRARFRAVRRSASGFTHRRVLVDVPDHLEAVLARAGAGITRAQLADVLVEFDPNADRGEALEFVDDLIEQQILVSDLQPAVTGGEPLDSVIEALERCAGGARAASRLRH